MENPSDTMHKKLGHFDTERDGLKKKRIRDIILTKTLDNPASFHYIAAYKVEHQITEKILCGS